MFEEFKKVFHTQKKKSRVNDGRGRTGEGCQGERSAKVIQWLDRQG